MILTVFPTLMENGSCFTQNFPFGAAHGLKSWVLNRKWRLGSFQRNWCNASSRHRSGWSWSLFGINACSLVTNFSYSTPEMFVMQNGFVIHISRCFDGQKKARLKNWQNLDWSTGWLYGSLPWPTDFNFQGSILRYRLAVKTLRRKDSSVSIRLG